MLFLALFPFLLKVENAKDLKVEQDNFCSVFFVEVFTIIINDEFVLNQVQIYSKLGEII